MTDGFLAFPLLLPGTGVWKGRQGRQFIVKVGRRSVHRGYCVWQRMVARSLGRRWLRLYGSPPRGCLATPNQSMQFSAPCLQPAVTAVPESTRPAYLSHCTDADPRRRAQQGPHGRGPGAGVPAGLLDQAGGRGPPGYHLQLGAHGVDMHGTQSVWRDAKRTRALRCRSVLRTAHLKVLSLHGVEGSVSTTAH